MTEVVLDKEVLKNKLAEYLSLGDGVTYGERLDAIKEKASFGAILALVFDGVKVLEKVVIDLVGITNANKQGQVKRDALVEFIDEAIELKGWFGMLEKFDGMIIGVLIDGLVGIYNTSFLSKWDDKAISFLDDASNFLDKK